MITTMHNSAQILTYPKTINETLWDEMQYDKSIILIGEGVDDPKGTNGSTLKLKEFFPSRVYDTPLAEEAMAGVAIGLALNGFKVIHNHIRMEFLLLAMNQLVNSAAKMHYMYGGEVDCNITIKVMIGKSWGQGPQHSQSFYPMLMGIPGLKIVAPVLPYDVKGILSASIHDKNPVIFVEHRHLYYQKGYVPFNNYRIDFPNLRTMRIGNDITIIGISEMAIECFKAGSYLEDLNIDAEILTPITLMPYDYESIKKSVVKTKKLLVVDNAWTIGGFGSEIISRLHQDKVNFVSKSIGFAFTTCPTTLSLEKKFYPDATYIAREAYRICKGTYDDFNINKEIGNDYEFKGPF